MSQINAPAAGCAPGTVRIMPLKWWTEDRYGRRKNVRSALRASTDVPSGPLNTEKEQGTEPDIITRHPFFLCDLYGLLRNLLYHIQELCLEVVVRHAGDHLQTVVDLLITCSAAVFGLAEQHTELCHTCCEGSICVHFL